MYTSNTFSSNFAQSIESMLAYRVALGLVKNALEANLLRFDRYCIEYHAETSTLSKDVVFGWMDYQQKHYPRSAPAVAMTIRYFARYLSAIGQDAYLLPEGFYPLKSTFSAYIFTDKELSELFLMIDTLPRKAKSTETVIAPILFRLIYTCGLRPNEGRELLRKNINLNTGEIHVVKTKRKKERLVVMSDDMLALCRRYSEGIKTKSEYFFPRFDGEVYTATQVDRIFKNCWEAANPGVADLPSVRTTDLRHRFASARLNRWLDEGRNLNVMLPYLRAYMGHEDLSETAYYIHVLPENLVKSAGVDWDSLNNLLPEVNVWQS